MSKPIGTRTQVRRLPERGHYDRETVIAILDSAFLCHVGFTAAEGHTVVLPTGYGRSGERLFLHGSAASAMLRQMREGIEVCCTVTLLDGLVLARSAFHHSMNYRSVVILGRARVLETSEEKLAALEAISEQIIPGRWAAVRAPTAQELKATLVLELPLTEASAKVRTGPPKDEADDYGLAIWAGVLPMSTQFSPAIPDPRLEIELAIPDYVRNRR